MSEEKNKPLKYQAAFKAKTLDEFHLCMEISTRKLKDEFRKATNPLIVNIEVAEEE